MKHSKIGASSYYRWKACPGSVKLSEGIARRESSYAKAGTIAHDLAAEMLENYFFQAGRPNIPANYDPEELRAVNLYVETIKSLAKQLSCDAKGGHVLIEKRVDLEEVYPGLFGTADAILYDSENKVLYVCDYKHGAGIPVEVEGNLQLQYYGLGAALNYSFPIEKVKLMVVQPRCEHPAGPIRTWEVDALDMLEFSAQLAEDAAATEDPNPVLVAGDHCRFCPAATQRCTLIQKKAQELVKTQFTKITDYDAKKLSEALRFANVLENWIKNVREFAYTEASHGHEIPGFKLVAKRATRKWKYNEDDTFKALMERFKLSSHDAYKHTLLSPAQIEKLITKDERPALEDLYNKESSGHTLVPETDKRKAVSVGAKADFTQIEED